jgi:2-phospho-L-lactate/phosphoenolpyruvate guanylyltransferase
VAAGWIVIIPVKPLAAAKSRISVSPEVRRRLAAAFALNTIHAAHGAQLVEDVVVLTSDHRIAASAKQLGAVVLADCGSGLNGSLQAALACQPQSDPAAILAADLPLLTSDMLDGVLASGADYERWHVRDFAGTGTTMLGARECRSLEPQFGPESSKKHLGCGFAQLPLPENLLGAAHDVDTVTDLRQVWNRLDPAKMGLAELLPELF